MGIRGVNLPTFPNVRKRRTYYLPVYHANEKLSQRDWWSVGDSINVRHETEDSVMNTS